MFIDVAKDRGDCRALPDGEVLPPESLARRAGFSGCVGVERERERERARERERVHSVKGWGLLLENIELTG